MKKDPYEKAMIVQFFTLIFSLLAVVISVIVIVNKLR